MKKKKVLIFIMTTMSFAAGFASDKCIIITIILGLFVGYIAGMVADL